MSVMLLLIAACTSEAPLEAPGLAARFVEPPAAWTLGVAGDGLGDAVATVGDLDGDGFDDLVAVSPEADSSATDFGQLDLFHGTASGPGASVDASPPPGLYAYEPGTTIAVVGDMSGLGDLVVAVGSPASYTGTVTQFVVSAGSLTTASQDGGGFGASRYGTSVAGADADGDGVVDLVAGDPYLDFSYTREGMVKATDWASTELWIVRGGAADLELGAALAVLDLDQDGFEEVVAGAPGASELWIFAGSATGLSTTPVVVPGTGRLGDALVATDLNADGVLDLVAGAPWQDVGGSLHDGAIHVWLGGTMPTATPDLTLTSPSPSAELGTKLVAPGDVDNDGYDDLLTLAYWWDGGTGAEVGAWLLYMGGPGGLEPDPAYTIVADDLPLGSLRHASATGGDHDGDGHADLVFGLSDWADPDAGQGALVWVRGGPRDLDDDGAVAADDCDDRDPTRFPGATEACNGIDDDCDGVVPASEDDADADGWRVCDGDCDDSDPLRHPDASEECNGVDDDCDGAPDFEEVDDDGDGFMICDDDCDDLDASIHPGAVEVCGSVDADCDDLPGDSDPDTVKLPSWYPDADGDGYGEPTLLGASCRTPPTPSVNNGDDCDDTNAAIHPGADEICNGGVDDDCDLFADAEDDSLTDGVSGYVDADGDGFGDPTEQQACDPTGLIADGTDCDDSDPDAWPGAPEVEDDGIDQDCDGADATSQPPTPTTPTDTGDEVPAVEDDGDKQEGGCGCGHGGAPSAAWIVALAILRRRWSAS